MEIRYQAIGLFTSRGASKSEVELGPEHLLYEDALGDAIAASRKRPLPVASDFDHTDSETRVLQKVSVVLVCETIDQSNRLINSAFMYVKGA